ncbi:MAG: rhodanese-like domain-containing protein [Candidatus Limnocylindrales bacterium]
MNAAQPGPLVSDAWVADHLSDADLRIVHVSTDRKIYDQAHLPGAIFVDLHADLAKGGQRPETGTAKRMYLVPSREDVTETLTRWGVAPGDRIVFYDDAGQGRHAIRGYWLLRLYGFPAERLHVLDGGLGVWQTEGRVTSAEATEPPRVEATERLHERDDSLIATAEQVLAWSREASQPGGPTRLLDVRRIDEFLGGDVRAARGGRIAGARHRLFTDFVAPDGRLRPAADAVAILEGSGVNPGELRATYCQGGIRAALVWFVLRELAGLTEVRNYAESWEEWGNRPELPVEK